MRPGRKTTGRTKGFVDGYMGLVADFYEDVVQHLTSWQQPAPKRKQTEAEDLNESYPN